MKTIDNLIIWGLVTLVIMSTPSCAVASAPGSQYYDYLTPQMYGAKGDGRSDDTEAFRRALYESHNQGKVLFIPSGSKFLVKGTLNYYDGKYQSYILNIKGDIPLKRSTYSIEKYGGIIIDKGVSLFKSATIKGSIERVYFMGSRDINQIFFNHCKCVGFVMTGCGVSNIGAMFQDTDIRTVSHITQNTFLSVYYFAKSVESSCSMVDSDISFNYIDGGSELNDNTCFEWGYYNGSTISNNFVDYYRTIYGPKAMKEQSFVGPNSYANQYQVFRYFFVAGQNIKIVQYSSNGDCFNWNEPSTLEKLQKYIPLTYKGKDGKTYEYPPYIAICKTTWNVSVLNAKIERNMRSLVFIDSGLTQYESNRFEVSFIGNEQFIEGQISMREGAERPLYNGGNFLQNEIKISGIVEVLDKLPNHSIGWTNSYNGRVVKVKGKLYRASNIYDGEKWIAEWSEINKESR